MKTLIVKDAEEFKKLEKDWNRLLFESNNDNIFLTFDWQYNWWKYFGKNYQLFIILVLGDDNRISGIMPLMKRRVYGFRQLVFISNSLADYEGFIIPEEPEKKGKTIDSFFTCLYQSSEWDMLKLSRIKEDTTVEPFYRDPKNQLRIFSGQHKEGAPYLELSDDWNKYCSGLRKKFLADTKRQSARLNEQRADKFIFKKVTAADEIENYINKLAELHRFRRRSKSTKSIFDDPVAHNFIKSIAGIFSGNGCLDLSVLQNSSIVAAINLGLKYKSTAHYYIPAFNDSLKQYSVGRLLLYELLRSSFNGSITEFDFMLGEEGYKNDWNTKIRKLYFFNVYPRTIKGDLAKFIFSFLNIKFKRFLNRNW